MNVVNIADQIMRELEPEDTSIPNIVFWLTSNLGQLNILLGTSYYLDVEGAVIPELGDSEAAILKYLYLIHYYNRLIKTNLGAGAYDFLELVEGDTTIRRASRTEIAKTYTQSKNALEDRLNQMIFMYRKNLAIPTSLSAVHNLIRFYRV